VTNSGFFERRRVASILLLALIACSKRSAGNDDEKSIKVTTVSARELRRAAEQWRGTHASDKCPTVEILRADKTVDPAGQLTDAWGTPFKIICEDDETRVMSAGPDQKEGTADDIWIPAEPTGRAPSAEGKRSVTPPPAPAAAVNTLTAQAVCNRIAAKGQISRCAKAKREQTGTDYDAFAFATKTGGGGVLVVFPTAAEYRKAVDGTNFGNHATAAADHAWVSMAWEVVGDKQLADLNGDMIRFELTQIDREAQGH
jgi:hypothetical protein